MGRYLIMVEVDTDRDEYGDKWGANHEVLKHEDSEVAKYVQTFGASPGSQWDYPPYTRTVRIEPLSDEGDHLDFVNVVEVEGRNGVDLFADLGAALRFRRAVDMANATEDPSPLYKARVYVGDDAERLIAEKRGDVLEGMGKPNLAASIRRGVAPADLLGLLQGRLEDVRSLLQQWAEEDAKGGEGK